MPAFAMPLTQLLQFTQCSVHSTQCIVHSAEFMVQELSEGKVVGAEGDYSHAHRCAFHIAIDLGAGSGFK